MSIREYAKSVGFEVVGKLKRLPDVYYGMDNKHHYPLWIDEAGNEYCGSNGGCDCYCIITADGGVI
jgi:urate oxidase